MDAVTPMSDSISSLVAETSTPRDMGSATTRSVDSKSQRKLLFQICMYMSNFVKIGLRERGHKLVTDGPTNERTQGESISVYYLRYVAD